jgi:hypothetical protein
VHSGLTGLFLLCPSPYQASQPAPDSSAAIPDGPGRRRGAGKQAGGRCLAGVRSNDIVFEEYPDDTPYPSHLILGHYEARFIHIVAVDNYIDKEIIVITVYEPDPSEWNLECRKRIQ